MLSDLQKISLLSAKALLRPETGWIHGHIDHPESSDLFIPVLENVAYALNLFLMKTLEGAEEGRVHLRKILHFEIDGNFPDYLHNYPNSLDAYLGIKLLPYFFWMKEKCQIQLGKELVKELDGVIERIVKKTHPETMPERIKAKLLAFEGDMRAIDIVPRCSDEWGDYLILLLMLIQKHPDKQKLLEEKFTNASKNWNFAMGAYIGPQEREKFAGLEPRTSLYDYAMAAFIGKFPERLKSISLTAVRASAAVPFPDEFCRAIDHHIYAWRALPPEPRAPFTLFFGDGKKLHSLVSRNEVKAELIAHEAGGEVIFDLEAEHDPMDTDPIELALYLDLDPAHHILIGGKKATVFGFGETISIRTTEPGYTQTLNLIFDLVQGEGKFYGHLAHGSRPGQVLNKGEHRFDAFDWKIYLRTVSKKAPVRLRLRYNLSV